MFHHLFWPAFFEHSICRKLQAQLRPSCFWIVEQDAVVVWALLGLFHQLLQPYSTVRRWDDEIEF